METTARERQRSLMSRPLWENAGRRVQRWALEVKRLAASGAGDGNFEIEEEIWVLERDWEGLGLRRSLAGFIVGGGAGGQGMVTTGRAHDGAFMRSRQLSK